MNHEIIRRYERRNMADTTIAVKMQLELLHAKVPEMPDEDKERAALTIKWLNRVVKKEATYGGTNVPVTERTRWVAA